MLLDIIKKHKDVLKAICIVGNIVQGIKEKFFKKKEDNQVKK